MSDTTLADEPSDGRGLGTAIVQALRDYERTNGAGWRRRSADPLAELDDTPIQYRHYVRAKYDAEQLNALGEKGHAFKNPDGSYSYPIDDLEDLGNAIKAVGRSGADHDSVRQFIMRRAKALGAMTKIPTSWNADGSIKGETRSEMITDQMVTVTETAGEPLVAFGDLIDLPARSVERFFTLDDISIRADGTGRTVVAYAAAFNDPTVISDQDGHYREIIAPHAFNKTIADRGLNFQCFYNHGRGLHGAPSDRYSMPLGTPIEIRPDGHGLLTVTRYSKTQLADEVIEGINNGAIRGQSFSGRFLPKGSVRTRGRGGELDQIVRNEIALHEYGPTPQPAYPGAVMVGVRSNYLDLYEMIRALTPEQIEEFWDTVRSHEPPSTPADAAAEEGTAADTTPPDIDHGDASTDDKRSITVAPPSPTYFERRQRLLEIRNIGVTDNVQN